MRLLGGVLQDARFGLRQLTAAPAFAVPALLSLALGIAVNTAMFSVVNTLLLRPVDVFGDTGVVRIGRNLRGDNSFRSVTRSEYLFLRERASSFSEVFGESLLTFAVGGGDRDAEVVSSEAVTGNYFTALNVSFASGRGFRFDDRQPRDVAVAVISERFWQRRFAGDAGIVGATININTRPFLVTGITSQRFRGTFPGVDVDLWIPAPAVALTQPSDSSAGQEDRFTLQLMGRLRAGQTLAGASAELDALSRQLDREDPSREPGRGFVVAEARGAHPAIARALQTFLALLMALVGVVLLIACANVASLQLARATARRTEFGIRIALGASRLRVVGQLFVESLILACCGAGLGLVIAEGLVRVVNSVALVPGPTGAPVALDLQLDVRVLAFTAASAVLTAIAFGLTPALEATRRDVITSLRGARTFAGVRRSRLRGALVTLQVALSVVLLVAAVLLSRGLRQAGRLDLGFSPDQVLVASMNLSLPGYDRERTRLFSDELLRRVRLTSGVTDAALAAAVPFSGRGGIGITTVRVRGGARGDVELRDVFFNRISDGYLSTIQQPLIRGRDFTTLDREGALPVVIVNETTAERLWADTASLGRAVRLHDETFDREVVGIVRDIRVTFDSRSVPLIYLPLAQRPAAALTLHARSPTALPALPGAITKLVRESDSDVAVESVRTMRETAAFSLFPAAVARAVAGASGVTGLLLASIGLYGLVSYTLTQRIREIGIRMAMGGNRLQVLRSIASGSLAFAAVGILVGLAVAAAAARFMRAVLYGVSPYDPVTFVSVAGLLLAVAAVATFAATRKLLRLSPTAALRHE